MNVNVFFEGGGILGVCYLGAYKALVDYGFRIDKCIGISAGSIMSALIIAGYTPNELLDIMAETNFEDFSSKTGLSKKTIVGKPMSLILNKGIYDSEIIENWMGNLLRRKGVCTFNDLMNGESCRLHIIAANSSIKQALILPNDLIYYGIKPESFSVAKAVRMSSAIPYYYTPVILKRFNREDRIIDGGVVKDIPTNLINHRINNWHTPTLRFKIKKRKKKNKESEHNVRKPNCRNNDDKIIIYNDSNIKFIDFNINRKQIIELYKQGYKCTENYLKKNYNLHKWRKF